MNGPDGKWIGYGVGDTGPQVAKIQHRLLHAYPANSLALILGVTESGVYTDATAAAMTNLQPHLTPPQPATGIANYATQLAMGAVVKAPVRPRYPIQGVYARSDAFLNPPDAPSFEKDTNAFAAEGRRLYSLTVGEPVVVMGYSMGGVSVKKFLDVLDPSWREFVKAVITFGDPAMPAAGSLLGDRPDEGISRAPQPSWCYDRYYSFAIDGDWYPQARGLMPFLYQILIRAELSVDFALWLFTQFPLLAMQQLMGTAPSTDPLAGVLGGLSGVLTGGLGVGAIFALLPQLVELLFDAIKFLATQAHGQYGDPGHALWDGMTGVDKAVAIVRENVPTATLFLFPGTWALWNQGFQFDVALRLQG